MSTAVNSGIGELGFRRLGYLKRHGEINPKFEQATWSSIYNHVKLCPTLRVSVHAWPRSPARKERSRLPGKNTFPKVIKSDPETSTDCLTASFAKIIVAKKMSRPIFIMTGLTSS